MKGKIIYIALLIVLTFILFTLVDTLAFKGIPNEFDAICMLVALIASHLITVKLLENNQ